MSSSSSTPQSIDENVDPIAVYSRSLYDYTLGLWTESRRVAEIDQSQIDAGVTDAAQHPTRDTNLKGRDS